jgi:hypothetical protein
MKVYGSTLQNNYGTENFLMVGLPGGCGGALNAFTGAIVEIYDSTFDTNHATSFGAGIYAWASEVNVFASTFESNSCGSGCADDFGGCSSMSVAGMCLETSQYHAYMLGE